MKKSIVFTLLFMATITVTANQSDMAKGHYRSKPVITHSGQKPVGAPLDGGLLMLLGGAGAAYYAAKKRRASENN